ncbi:hypothetical protein [Dietzia sp.]|uniref:hypothetical protein n=1 Tax=Dietzia sp. TaxID=1871616 RepID=UPI002FD9D309
MRSFVDFALGSRFELQVYLSPQVFISPLAENAKEEEHGSRSQFPGIADRYEAS